MVKTSGPRVYAIFGFKKKKKMSRSDNETLKEY